LLQLDPENYGARAWAVRALVGIGDVRGLELLVDALGTDVAASVRRAAAKGLGALRLGDLEPARQAAIQARCLDALLAATSVGFRHRCPESRCRHRHSSQVDEPRPSS
jgi:phycocyanobilin lyase beta subunit